MFALVVLLIPAPAPAAEPIRLAVAPFAGETDAWPVAEAITGRLARRPLERLIAPDAFVARAEFEPRAAEVRRWAYNAAVDAIVVGRLLRPAEAGSAGGPFRVEAVLRSGHSGAELTRHDVALAGPAELGASAEQLAAAILSDLGFVEPAVAPETSAVPGAAAEVPAPSEGPSGAPGGRDAGGRSGRGLEARLDRAGFRADAPIEIKADEAEIVDRGATRQLVFQQNVRVRQDNVTLRSDRLEADYRKGESEPIRLVARGAVRVDQGDRHAECDEAIYLRDSQQLSCAGRAELIQGCDVVRGDRIEFDLARDTAHVQGAASIVIRPEADGEPAPGGGRSGEEAGCAVQEGTS